MPPRRRPRASRLPAFTTQLVYEALGVPLHDMSAKARGDVREAGAEARAGAPYAGAEGTAQLADEFEKRNVKPLGLSTDTAAEHARWIEDVNDTQNTNLVFPIVADADLKIAKLYDMIPPDESETAAVRSVFLIDPDKKVRLTMTYPMSVGRNFDEILRAIDALQFSDKHGVATPADWRHGKVAIIPPSVSDEDAKARFPQGFTTLRPYLRTVAID